MRLLPDLAPFLFFIAKTYLTELNNLMVLRVKAAPFMVTKGKRTSNGPWFFKIGSNTSTPGSGYLFEIPKCAQFRHQFPLVRSTWLICMKHSFWSEGDILLPGAMVSKIGQKLYLEITSICYQHDWSYSRVPSLVQDTVFAVEKPECIGSVPFSPWQHLINFSPKTVLYITVERKIPPWGFHGTLWSHSLQASRQTSINLSMMLLKCISSIYLELSCHSRTLR